MGAVAADGRCFAHLSGSALDGALETANRREYIDARGVCISGGLLSRLIDAAQSSIGDPRILRAVKFDQAVFDCDADFEAVTFDGEASFVNATFQKRANFYDARFNATSAFRGTTFLGDARFTGPFKQTASFPGTTFAGEALFGGGTEFHGGASFFRAVFKMNAKFHKARFRGLTIFGEATFLGFPVFGGAVVDGDADFRHTTFRRGAVGPMLVTGLMLLDGVTTEDTFTLRVAANGLSIRSAKFRGPTRLQVRWAEIMLDDSEFLERSTLTTGEKHFLEDALTSACARSEESAKGRSERVRLVSLRGAYAGNLVLSNTDLRACRFLGSHGLDQLRLEGPPSFASSPSALRWTARQTLAEEHLWRSKHRPGWYPCECRPPAWMDEQHSDLPSLEHAPDTNELASLYRALRKSREDNKDEPGSADFYYGEMEMRRLTKGRTKGVIGSRGERILLWLYWAVSGYGLRASRAFISLVLVVLGFAVLLYSFGLQEPNVMTALLHSLEGAAVRGAEPGVLNEAGRFLVVPLRLLGPILLGLAILSLRGRVRR